jgi:hypothetical protein
MNLLLHIFHVRVGIFSIFYKFIIMKKQLLLSFITAIIFPIASFSAVINKGSSLAALHTNLNLVDYKDTIQWSKQKTAAWFVDRFKLGAGFFNATTTTEIAIGNNSGSIGSNIDFEKELGLQRNTGTFMANFQWRISRRWRMDVSYYQLNRSASATLQRTINFGDNTYNVSANVSSFFNNTIYRVSWGYAILAKPTAELGLLIGTHTLQTNIGIGLTAGGAGVAYKDNYNLTAPLPDFGIWGGLSLAKRWALNGEFDYLTITTGNIKGDIVGYNASLNFKATQHFDLLLGYTGFNFSVDANKGTQSGHIGWGYHGPSVTANIRFGHNNWRH